MGCWEGVCEVGRADLRAGRGEVAWWQWGEGGKERIWVYVRVDESVL